MIGLTVFVGVLSAIAFAWGSFALVSWQIENSENVRRLRAAADASSGTANLRAALKLLWGRRIDRSSWGQRFAIQLIRADLPLSPSEFIAVFLGAVVVLSMVVALVFHLNPVLDLLIGLLLAILLARFYMESRQDRYLNLLAAQIPDVALLVSNSLKAGLAAPQAFRVVSEKMTRPANTEFGRLFQEIQMGTPADQAMQRMLERFPSEELTLLLTTIIIQRQAGGNLAHALTVASNAIAMRYRVRNEISTLTAEARFTSFAILLIPIFTLALLNQVLSGAVTEFLSTLVGFVLLIVFIVVLAVAFLMVNQISRIRV